MYSSSRSQSDSDNSDNSSDSNRSNSTTPPHDDDDDDNQDNKEDIDKTTLLHSDEQDTNTEGDDTNSVGIKDDDSHHHHFQFNNNYKSKDNALAILTWLWGIILNYFPKYHLAESYKSRQSGDIESNNNNQINNSRTNITSGDVDDDHGHGVAEEDDSHPADKRDLVVQVDERLPIGPLMLASCQHVLAMFGSSVICPLLMGFSINTALLFSGLGTIIFYICTGGRVPSYVGSSFAFIGVVNSATGFVYVPGGHGNQNIPVATGGIFVCGLVYLVMSLVVMFVGSRWLEILMPHVVTGTVVIAIGLNLSVSAISQASATGFDAWMAMVTVICVSLVTVYAPGPFRRIPILIGGLTAYLIYLFCGLGGVGPGIDYQIVRDSKWIGAPPTTLPKFEGSAISLITPVAIILMAENVGHIKAVGSITGKPIDHLLGRAFLGDSLATLLAATCGSIGTTTYAENIGVMSITKNFSSLTFLIAAGFAILFGILPIFGAVTQTIPSGVFGGLSLILFGMVGISGARIWITNRINFSRPRNLLTAGVGLVLGAGMATGQTVTWGPIKMDGIGTATLSTIVLYQLLRDDWGEIFRKIIGLVWRRNKSSNQNIVYDDQHHDNGHHLRSNSSISDVKIQMVDMESEHEKKMSPYQNVQPITKL